MTDAFAFLKTSRRRSFTALEVTAIDAEATAREWGMVTWETEEGREIIELTPPASGPAFTIEPVDNGVEVWSWADDRAFHFGSVKGFYNALGTSRSEPATC